MNVVNAKNKNGICRGRRGRLHCARPTARPPASMAVLNWCAARSVATPATIRNTGAALGLPASRCYSDWQQMLEAERALPAEQRMELLVIVTPNHLHAPIASQALSAGFHVFSEKPAALNLAELLALKAVLETQRPPLWPGPHVPGLSDGLAGARNGAQRRDRRGAQGHCRVPPGLAQPGCGRAGQQAGRLARPARAVRVGRLHWRYRHPCLFPGRVRRGSTHRAPLRDVGRAHRRAATGR